jgi:FAD/FMN-containing dehydrogenases
MTDLEDLQKLIKGELHVDCVYRNLYATDASAYRELPLGVVYPKDDEDLKKIIAFAREKEISLIPRGAGTSLAGQVVGKGLVVDISKNLNQILDVDVERRTVTVQPGIILDTLNQQLKPLNLFFSPETSTSSRCCLGGMVGNNSCGSHSIVYGNTRDHLLSAKVLLSDASEVILEALTATQVEEKCKRDTFEGEIYRKMTSLLQNKKNQDLIRSNFPDPKIKRRNTGYALDELMSGLRQDATDEKRFNFCKLLAGSEGTLAFATAFTLTLDPLPPKEKMLLCVHCKRLEETFQANLIALRHHPSAVELMDKNIVELSKGNITQQENRKFIIGEPAAILIIELNGEQKTEIDQEADMIEKEMKAAGFGYAFVRVYNADTQKVWALRKAALGLLISMPGNAKPFSVIEDTAVLPERLPDYMHDFGEMLKRHSLSCVYHAHIGSGELHLRPILNPKEEQDLKTFRNIAEETAVLVKKYKGSLSGEHGDGRLRGEFIPLLFGEETYQLFKQTKEIWDPKHLFNPNKIVDTPAMDSSLRYAKAINHLTEKTYYDFTKEKGWLTAIEQCNGSADCRKTADAQGGMCPTFKATGDERLSTRGRANILRTFLTEAKDKSVFKNKDIIEVLSNCLSCKACKAECPSNVDMTKFKAEFLQHYYDTRHGVPMKSFAIANFDKIQALASHVPNLYNFFGQNKLTSGLIKNLMGFAPERHIPKVERQTFRRQFKKYHQILGKEKQGKVYLFADEFTNYNEAQLGMDTVNLLNRLGYEVEIPKHRISGRTYLSKGMVKAARKIIKSNILSLKDLIKEETPLIGIEPSCILSFRDEYISLSQELKGEAEKLAKNCLLSDEFIHREIQKGKIKKEDFDAKPQEILLHGHCYQKALGKIGILKQVLSFPENRKVSLVETGCCGMAGAYGYEKKNYQLSKLVAEQKLLPAVRNRKKNSIVVAPGTSCRTQIKDGTGETALHPMQFLLQCLK